MIRALSSLLPRRLAGWLAVGVCVSAATLAWFGFRAIREWQRSAALLADRRAEEAADLLVTALTRDMRAVQTSVLSSADWDELMLDPASDVSHLIASAFARYPYPEAFFGWRGPSLPASMVFFGRSDRHPSWLSADSERNRFPVVVGNEPVTARRLLERIGEDAARGRRFSIFDVNVGTARYQVVALLFYEDALLRERPDAVFGFMVNLEWVRQHYFQELTTEVGRITSADGGLVLTIFDASGKPVANTGGETNGGPAGRRVFSVTFFDPPLVALDPPRDLTRESWTAQAIVSNDRTLLAASQGARRTLAIAAVAAVVLAGGLVLTARAVHANANLAEMRSDFVSMVTHELKTPIANIRAIGETLASGRIRTPETSREYAQMAVQEAKRLTRLIDNLLAYARITDVTEAYSFEPVGLETVVNESLQEFASQLAEDGFDVRVEIPRGLPPVRADRTAIALMLDNLLDNAIRYSRNTRYLSIGARLSGAAVILDVADKGIGIPQDEVEHVTRKFFRGHGAGSGGSGLGLAIAHRIVMDHGGSLAIRSTVGTGTTVSVTLPPVQIDDEETDSCG